MIRLLETANKLSVSNKVGISKAIHTIQLAEHIQYLWQFLPDEGLQALVGLHVVLGHERDRPTGLARASRAPHSDEKGMQRNAKVCE